MPDVLHVGVREALASLPEHERPYTGSKAARASWPYELVRRAPWCVQDPSGWFTSTVRLPRSDEDVNAECTAWNYTRAVVCRS
eukprot:6329608-Prymnesium_polylepis.1